MAPPTGSPPVWTSGLWTPIRALLGAVADYLAQGYVRIKLKIEPAWDICW